MYKDRENRDKDMMIIKAAFFLIGVSLIIYLFNLGFLLLAYLVLQIKLK